MYLIGGAILIGVFALVGVFILLGQSRQRELRVNNVDFDQYKTQEIQRSGHYHNIVQ
ncbi:hypothetical protein [Desulfovibrio inopinatus]|uniref:hypothetical protein n=1 Tax=Desulfovibrio inopinatus TaxID=102109 RepID=UPI00041947A0|nr:hypothetical protein [Desulfovibrio inopinatus]